MPRHLKYYFACLLLSYPMVDLAARKVKQSLKVTSAKSDTSSKKEMEHDNQGKRIDADTITFITLKDGSQVPFDPDSITFVGYEKEANANNESFLIVNNSPLSISGIEIKIIYKDLKNRMLHSRTVIHNCIVPSHETIKTYIKTWDRQKTYYYYLGNEPRKIATPYKIEIIPLAFFTEN